MSVYVDRARIPYRGMLMCHMLADTVEELHAMADKLGVRKYYQGHRSRHPHYDICQAKRVQAIKLGALEPTRDDLRRLLK